MLNDLEELISKNQVNDRDSILSLLEGIGYNFDDNGQGNFADDLLSFISTKPDLPDENREFIKETYPLIGIDDTRESIEGKTLGSYLNEIYPKENAPFQMGLERIRNRYTTRQMYVDEFELIWNKQSQYHKKLNEDLKTILGGRKSDGYKEDGILFHQRPLRSQKHLVGNCSFEPSKTKCPISAIPFELFRITEG